MSKYTSKAVVLQKSIASVFTTITQLESITYPDGKVEFLDVTDLAGGVGREKLPSGYVDTQPCQFSGFLDPVGTTHKNLTADITAPPAAAQSWKILNPDGSATAWPFSGWVANFVPRAKVGEPLRVDGSVQPTGLVTYPT